MDKDTDQQFQSTSPMPQEDTRTLTYLFFDALRETLNGRRITRQAWENKEIYGYMHDGLLKIHGGETGDRIVHNWILSAGDMTADDWIILPEGN